VTGRRGSLWRASAVIAGRHLTHLHQTPSLLALTVAQPALFVVLFTYGFGGAIHPPGVSHYIDYLLPGIVVLAVAFGSSQTGTAFAEDAANGTTDRLRTLPIPRAAIFLGRSLADTVRNLFVIALMTGLGTLVGFRTHRSLLDALVAIAVVVLLGLAFSWVSALIGLIVASAETAQVATLLLVIPLAFSSSMFVPVATMPEWLAAFARVNPVTRTVDAVRGLTMPDGLHALPWPAVAWSAVLLALAIPATLARDRRHD
jgi:ABC transporter DrrB family efflux protein